MRNIGSQKFWRVSFGLVVAVTCFVAAAFLFEWLGEDEMHLYLLRILGIMSLLSLVVIGVTSLGRIDCGDSACEQPVRVHRHGH